MKIPPPFKTPTPYGGRLTWILPGGNFLIAHLKDKTKIRHKKRWSQVRLSCAFHVSIAVECLGDVYVLSTRVSFIR